MKIDYSKENLEKVAKESWCGSDMNQKLGGKWKYTKTLKKYIQLYKIDVSHFRKQLSKIELDTAVLPKTELQKQILLLRNEDLSFNEIANKLNCSKSTISYNLKAKQRTKTKSRQKARGWLETFNKHISRFKEKIGHVYVRPIDTDWNQKFRRATSRFQRMIRLKNMKNTFGYKDVLNKYNNETIITCYLTGDQIDLTKDNYAFDHIVPLSKGGSCDLDNLGITTYEANAAKAALTVDEFVELCKKVCIHHGYKVEKL